jgi:hypothetical protein
MMSRVWALWPIALVYVLWVPLLMVQAAIQDVCEAITRAVG